MDLWDDIRVEGLGKAVECLCEVFAIWAQRMEHGFRIRALGQVVECQIF